MNQTAAHVKKLDEIMRKVFKRDGDPKKLRKELNDLMRRAGDPEAEHEHRCTNPECGFTIWRHKNNCNGIEEAHKCPRCNREQWRKYEGEDKPDVTMPSCANMRPEKMMTALGLVPRDFVKGFEPKPPNPEWN